MSSLSSFGSDHCSILINTGDNPLVAPHSFKFDQAWTQDPEFVELFYKWWLANPLNPDGDVALHWKTKIHTITNKMKGWAKNYYGKKKQLKQQALSGLHKLEILKEQRDLTIDELEELNSHKFVLKNIYLEEEQYSKARSKQ
jgi:hypothetical protein